MVHAVWVGIFFCDPLSLCPRFFQWIFQVLVKVVVGSSIKPYWHIPLIYQVYPSCLGYQKGDE